MPLPFLLAVAVLALPPDAAATPHAEQIAMQVRNAFVLDDNFYFEQLVLDAATRGRETDDLRHVIDRHDCLVVRRFNWEVTAATDDTIELRLDINAAGLTKALARPEVQFPRWWRIEAKRVGGEWKLAAAMTEERFVALQMLAAPSIDAADRIFRTAKDVDPHRLLLEYADEVNEIERVRNLDHALALAREMGDASAEALVLRGFATLSMTTNTTEYVPHAAQALVIALERGTADDRAGAYFTSGVLHGILGHYDTADAHLAASAALVGEVMNPILPLKSKLMQIYFHNQSGRLLEALKLTEDLAERSRTYGWDEGQEQALFRRAFLQSTLNNDEVAVDAFRHVVRITLARGNRKFAAYSLHNTAPHLVALGRPGEALRGLERALELWPDLSIQPTIYTTMAEVYMVLGRYADAETALRKVAEVERALAGKFIDLPASHHRLWSELHLRAGRPSDAIASALEAIAMVVPRKDVGSEPDHALSELALGRAYRAAGRIEDAIAHLRASVKMTESRRASSMPGQPTSLHYAADRLKAHAELVELLVERGQIEEAFHVAEEMKGRALRDIIAGGRIELSVAMTAAERAREEELEGLVVELNRALQHAPTPELRNELASARRQLEAFDAEMRVRYPALVARRVGAGDGFELPGNARSLAVIQYVVANEQTIAFCLTRDANGGTALHAERLPVRHEQLERAIARFARLVGSRSLTYRDEARALYELLLQPLEKHFANATSLAIIPDNSLWAVPFQALIASDGTHLVERTAVFYAHSLALLRHAMTRPIAPRPRLLAFGNPTVGSTARATMRSAFRDVPLGALPEAETEVRSLRTMYSPQRSRAYWRDAARETVFKQEADDFDIIHVAAHAVVDDAAPMYSAIVLAASRTDAAEDGLLEAREVADLPLKADLAVLSACDTARGKVGAGEGVVGIAWAFFAAGCPTTVVSQWKAESRATSKLMIEFHRRLLAGDTVAEALRRAQLTIRRDPRYAHPFYWAPFVAVGGAARDVAGHDGRPR